MNRPVVECVPNFSEGRDPAVIDAIVEVIESAGAAVLDRTSDPDHNRSVVTFAGTPAQAAEAAFRAVERAAALIDLRLQQGVHPRIGAADVVPFVPVSGITLAECAALAESVGRRIWEELGIPVYLYEAAARRPDRANLANLRRGGFEGLREEVRVDPDRLPDFGGPELHPSAGAAVVGARQFLIACNLNLSTPDVAVARRIARAIRESSGGLARVKALGLPLASRGQAQVSINLTDFETTPLDRVVEAVRGLAEREGVAVVETEIIGLLPRRALEGPAAHLLGIAAFHPGMILENRIEERMPASSLAAFLDEMSGPASAAIAAAAMAATLGERAARTAGRPPEDIAIRRRFFAAAALRPGPADDECAWHEAARDLIEAAEDTARLRTQFDALRAADPPAIETAIALATASLASLAVVLRAALARIADQEVVNGIEDRLARLDR